MLIRNYRKNIGLMAGVEFFAFLGITSFWILFLSQNGMSLWQIGLLEVSFIRPVLSVKFHLEC